MNKRIRKKKRESVYSIWSFASFVQLRGPGVERIVRREYIRRRNRLRPCPIGIKIPAPLEPVWR